MPLNPRKAHQLGASKLQEVIKARAQSGALTIPELKALFKDPDFLVLERALSWGLLDLALSTVDDLNASVFTVGQKNFLKGLIQEMIAEVS